MKIAISGAHCVGKTTLVAELARALPQHKTVDEPYLLLLEVGHDFPELPGRDDFELLLGRSLDCIASVEKDCIFDRSPLDQVAYLLSLPAAEGVAIGPWLRPLRHALKSLDLIVYLPVESPDRMAAAEHPGLRRRVDQRLRDILLEDPWDFGVEVLQVTGDPRERVRRVLAYLASTAPAVR